MAGVDLVEPEPAEKLDMSVMTPLTELANEVASELAS
jgi:hypothetical protein